MNFPLTRKSALARLDAFVADAAATYGARRNFVDPSGHHDAVSRLSAALRRRLISEEEVVRAVLAAHRYPAVEKFIAEVFWRTYWKGWLEHHPAMWPDYKLQVETKRDRLEQNSGLAGTYRSAVEGRTGIEAFDHWADELQRTGYLHNWARMQMASIWIFTLGLPWALGTDWMYAHLLDADPASNTLSWRWVAGLHTSGKTYLADEDRILAMTGCALSAKGLATAATLPQPAPAPVRTDLRAPMVPDISAPSLLLLTRDDLSLETELDLKDVRGILVLDALVATPADRIAITDAADRAAARWRCDIIHAADVQDVVRATNERQCAQIVIGFATAGPDSDALAGLGNELAAQGIALTEHLRRWDQLAWPYCTNGFFQLRSRIPALLKAQGIIT